MDGWTDEWVDGWIMDGWVDRRMNGRVGFHLKPSFPPETFVQINPTHRSPRLSGVLANGSPCQPESLPVSAFVMETAL